VNHKHWIYKSFRVHIYPALGFASCDIIFYNACVRSPSPLSALHKYIVCIIVRVWSHTTVIVWIYDMESRMYNINLPTFYITHSYHIPCILVFVFILGFYDFVRYNSIYVYIFTAYCCLLNAKNKNYEFIESNNNKIIDYKTMKLANDNNLKRIIISL